MVTWHHLPPALVPSPGGHDADGCFSGCAAIGGDGLPVLLYTGVRLRSNAEAGPPPPPEHDLQLPFVESQLAAVPESSGDPLLSRWRKLEAPVLPLPPANLPLVGWRDPFIFEVKGEVREGMMARGEGGAEGEEEQNNNSDHHRHREWGMLLGSGFKGRGGTVLVYRSDELHGGWRFEGTLCEAESVDTGAMWECPLIARLSEREEAGCEGGGGSGWRGGGANRSGVVSNIVPAPPTASSSSSAASAASAAPPSLAESAADAAAAQAEEAAAAAISGLKLDGEGSSKEKGRRRREGDDDNGGDDDEPSSSSSSSSAAPPPRPHDHFFCVSPDAPTNPVLYWTGSFDAAATRFRLEEASGPHRLDLGDVLYAPNLMTDALGRRVLWGWLQERRGGVGSYDYAGCLSLPRLLSLRNGRLFQEPLPEVALLRESVGDGGSGGSDDENNNNNNSKKKSKNKLRSWSAEALALPPEVATPVEGVRSPRLDVSVTLERGSAVAAGVLVRSWNAGGEGSAAIVVDWEAGVLEAVFEGGDEGMGKGGLTNAQRLQRLAQVRRRTL